MLWEQDKEGVAVDICLMVSASIEVVWESKQKIVLMLFLLLLLNGNRVALYPCSASDCDCGPSITKQR